MQCINLFSRMLLVPVFCLLLTLPTLAGASDQGILLAAAASASPETLQRDLDDFAQRTIASINRCILPSEGKKEVTRNGDGSYTARYIAINPKSVSTSYKKPDKVVGGVTYIGYMRYDEIEYSCTAKSKAEAERGPFTVKRSENLTELIKYVNGKWSY
ncbi:hypothetical protein LJC59_09435 [Desulfovibrio sp. OttesenSCG-928-A18]|nr:hypothetical protein [Desulfovibrio sp. OttesenSCG-928-A18]